MITPGRNLNIQALRALAALLVVAGHAAHETLSMGGTGRAPVDLSVIRWSLGIDIFFVISGFIMVYTSVGLFGRPGGWRVFLLRRIGRIVPLYWLLTSALLIGAVLAPKLLNVPIDDWRHVLASYLFIPSLRAPGEIRPVMALGWTLNMEMFFYVLFAAVLALPFRRGLTALAAVILALTALGLIWRPEQVQIAFWTQSLILEFLFGCLLAAAHLRGLRIGPATAMLLLALGFAGMFDVLGSGDASNLPDGLRWGVPALSIVAAAALFDGGAARPVAVLAGLGNASYSLYLIHPFALRPLRNIWSQTIGGALPLAFYVMAATGASILAAVLLYRFIERPMLRWSQALLRPSEPARQTPQASLQAP